MQENSKNFEGIDQKSIILLMWLALLGVAISLAFALQASERHLVISQFSFSLILSGSASLSGGFLGLLFGIPRRLQVESRTSSENEGHTAREAGTSSQYLYAANTNLEQISDWLTKILVGVGLTQISNLDEILTKFGAYASAGLGSTNSASVFAACLFSYFLVDGFLIGYLWTRLYLGRALTVADSAALLEEKLSEVERQAEFDALWLQLATKQLRESQAVPQDNLNRAAINSSTVARGQIFYMAANQRDINWREDFRKPKMEKTIPVFRALIASDKNDEYHANHGQLGFALMRKTVPDWREAEEQLCRAIALRGEPSRFGHCEYEAARAICRIMNENKFNKGVKSELDDAKKIRDDISIACQSKETSSWAMKDEAISAWIALNGDEEK